MSNNKENPIFIGARALTNEEVRIIVPTYDGILERIRGIREEASKVTDKHTENEKKFNNTIALFGERGTGKTSTMYTLLKELKGSTKDIVLDTIEPDNIGTEGKIMGCILGLLQDKIKEIQNEVKNENPNELTKDTKQYFFDDCKFIERNPLQVKYDELLECYCYTEKDYRNLLISTYTDMNSYRKKTSYLLNADLQFAKKFTELIDEMIKVKNQMKNDTNKEEKPLIFIFIDDVDLNTMKCQEIIESILKYTSHPNIVCFISGDYTTFSEAVTISLLKKEELPKANLHPENRVNINNINILQSKQELGYQYMKKIFPPAHRHYVNTWEISLRPLYGFDNVDNNNTMSMYELLKELIEIRKGENIFGYEINKEGSTYFLPAYHMFDETSRGLINVYYTLFTAIKNKNRYEDTSKYFTVVKTITESIIDSSKLLSNRREDIRKRIILWGSEEEQSRIDFKQIEIMFENYETNKDNLNIEDLKAYYSIFYLSYFISVLLPKVKHSENSKKEVSIKSMNLLIFHPKLNGKDYEFNIGNRRIKLLESENRDEFLYRFNGSYPRKILLELLREVGLFFSQRLYKNIVESKLGYDFLYRPYVNGSYEESNNSVYLAFYQSLSRYREKDVELLKNLYLNKNLKKCMEFIKNKSEESNQDSYTKIIFSDFLDVFSDEFTKLIFKEKCENTEHKDEIRRLCEEFLFILKLEKKRACVKQIPSVVSKKNELESYLEEIVEKYHKLNLGKRLKKSNYKETRLYELNRLTYELLYKLHKKEVERKNKKEHLGENSKEAVDLYKNNKLVEQITEYTRAWVSKSCKLMFKNIIENKSIIRIDISSSNIMEKLNKFHDGIYGSSYTNAERCKDEISLILESLDNIWPSTINLEEYTKVKDELRKLINSTSWYGIDEANELLMVLNTEIRVCLENESFFDDQEEWLMQAYSLFIQKSKPEITDISDIEEAKGYLKDVLIEARNKQIEEENDYLKELDIENYDEF
ncbi:MAG: hypothetical protein JJT76_02800 [Clostridiaceae bacterium]|nr:hypothetical protein [Clostridiaceae bacterium]